MLASPVRTKLRGPGHRMSHPYADQLIGSAAPYMVPSNTR